MQETKGHCKHGEFILGEGCPQCIADRMAVEGNTEVNIKEAIAEIQKAEPFIIKVKYYSESTEELSPREYTYYSADQLKVDDIVTVPVRDTTGKAKVSAVGVAEAEIASFKDKVKTIPSGSVIEQGEIEAEAREQATMERLTGIGDEEDIGAVEPANETTIALRPGEDIEVHGYYEESIRMLEYAGKRVVATLEEAQSANDDLALISKLTKLMDDKRRALLAPLEAQKIEIRDTYKYLMAPIIEANTLTRDKMLAYDTKQRLIQQEQERINQQRLEVAQAEMNLKGELTESVNLMEVTEAPKKVSTDMGTSYKTDRWKYRIDNPDLLPREYMIPDDAMLSLIAKRDHDKKQIPGVTFYNDPFYTVRAR